MASDLLSCAAALIWPVSCPCCGAAEQWCRDCRPAGPGIVLHRRGIGPVAAVGPHTDGLAAAIRAWKLGGRRDLTPLLAEHLAAASALLVPPGAQVSLVPVPVRRASLRRRGADLVGDLAAQTAARVPGLRVDEVLRFRRQVGEQVGSDPFARRGNLRHAMAARRGISGAVLAVDDVLTTGATLAEAVRALYEAGAAAAAAAVLSVADDPRSVARRMNDGG